MKVGQRLRPVPAGKRLQRNHFPAGCRRRPALRSLKMENWRHFRNSETEAQHISLSAEVLTTGQSCLYCPLVVFLLADARPQCTICCTTQLSTTTHTTLYVFVCSFIYYCCRKRKILLIFFLKTQILITRTRNVTLSCVVFAACTADTDCSKTDCYFTASNLKLATS